MNYLITNELDTSKSITKNKPNITNKYNKNKC